MEDHRQNDRLPSEHSPWWDTPIGERLVPSGWPNEAPVRVPMATPNEICRTILRIMKRSWECVGGRPEGMIGKPFVEQATFILEHAHQSNLDAELYATIWSLREAFRAPKVST